MIKPPGRPSTDWRELYGHSTVLIAARVPVVLRNQLRDLAQANERSMTDELIRAIIAHLE
jgi:Arc-like DNA binding domain